MRLPFCLILAALVGSLIAAPAPADLVAASDLGGVFGVTFKAPDKMPAEQDDELGAMQHVAMYQSPQLTGLVFVYEFPSAAAAAAKTTKEKLAALVDEENAAGVTVAPESGLGDRAFWLQDPDGCGLAVVKGSRLFVVVGTGKLPRPADAYREKLHALAAAVLGKL